MGHRWTSLVTVGHHCTLLDVATVSVGNVEIEGKQRTNRITAIEVDMLQKIEDNSNAGL